MDMRLVDADTMIDKYGEWYTEEGTEEGYIGTIKGIVDGMPTIEERKKGKWERHYSRPNVYADLCWHCSCCGYKTPDGWAYKLEYCPNCGAKMDGGEEE